MIKYSIYKLGNLFKLGNSFLLCYNVNSFNYSDIKRKINNYNIKERMKNSLKSFPFIKEYHNKVFNNQNYEYLRKGVYISLSFYLLYKFAKRHYFANRIDNRVIQYFSENPKIIDELLDKFDKLCENDNFRKRTFKKLNSYMQKNYILFKHYINPLIKNKLKKIIRTEEAQILIIEIFRKTILNNNNIQNIIIKYINNNLNSSNEGKYIDNIESIFIKIFEKEEFKELFYLEFFNSLNKKLLEEEVIKSTSKFIEKNVKI
jgi:hypothetical protein